MNQEEMSMQEKADLLEKIGEVLDWENTLPPKLHKDLETFARTLNYWCNCSKGFDNPKFYDDGSHSGCEPKHHYHCGYCMGIYQVG